MGRPERSGYLGRSLFLLVPLTLRGQLGARIPCKMQASEHPTASAPYKVICRRRLENRMQRVPVAQGPGGRPAAGKHRPVYTEPLHAATASVQKQGLNVAPIGAILCS